MGDMDPEAPHRDPFGALEQLTLDMPATCRHRCHCSCHRTGAKHVMACCTGCGHGHTQIDPLYLQDHLRQCHGLVQL